MGYLTNKYFFSVPRYITHEKFSKKKSKVPLLGDQFPSYSHEYHHYQTIMTKMTIMTIIFPWSTKPIQKSGGGGLPVQAWPGNGGHHLKATFREAFSGWKTMALWGNHWKTMGKPWETQRKTDGTCWILAKKHSLWFHGMHFSWFMIAKLVNITLRTRIYGVCR